MNTVLNPIHPAYGFPCPLTLKCTVTGEPVTYSDPEYIKTRIEKAGGLEQLIAVYVSKAGKRQLHGSSPRPEGRTWKGETIQASPASDMVIAKDSSEALSIKEQTYLQDGVPMVHREFRGSNKSSSWICNVYVPDLRGTIAV